MSNKHKPHVIVCKALAAECYRDETSLWHHPLLAHNAAERARLNTKVKSILF